MIESLEIHNFTCFDDFKIDFAEGVNIFIGDNGTGKTHILKLLYSILNLGFKEKERNQGKRAIVYDNPQIYSQILRNFLPYSSASFLRSQQMKEAKINVRVYKDEVTLTITKEKFSYSWGFGLIEQSSPTMNLLQPNIYIPPKEILSNAPGFRSLYEHREIHFEEIYKDILSKAFLDPLRELNTQQKTLLTKLKEKIGGEVTTKGETFFLKSGKREIEFDLLAEGIRKLALLWLLIRNGSLDKGSTLCWDEPETNLNPSMFPIVVEVLLELQHMGVQMFIATHSYDLLREFDLQRKDHSLKFYSLYKEGKNDPVKCNSTDNYLELSPNKIEEEGERIYNMIIDQELEHKNG